jgi:hypothetical protein
MTAKPVHSFNLYRFGTNIVHGLQIILTLMLAMRSLLASRRYPLDRLYVSHRHWLLNQGCIYWIQFLSFIWPHCIRTSTKLNDVYGMLCLLYGSTDKHDWTMNWTILNIKISYQFKTSTFLEITPSKQKISLGQIVCFTSSLITESGLYQILPK